jgi:hypothetical protein
MGNAAAVVSLEGKEHAMPRKPKKERALPWGDRTIPKIVSIRMGHSTPDQTFHPGTPV